MLKACCIGLLLLAPVLAREQQPLITGNYLEDRSNKVFGCYCEWSGEGETGGKEAVLAWHITSGEYDGADSSGLNAVLVTNGDRTLSRPGADRRSMLFIDGTGNLQQFRALEKLIRRNYGELAGRILGTEVATIEFERAPDAATVRIGGKGEVRIRKARLPQDALQGAILWYDPFIALTESNLGTTLSVRYFGSGFNHTWTRYEEGVTGYFGTFTLFAK